MNISESRVDETQEKILDTFKETYGLDQETPLPSDTIRALQNLAIRHEGTVRAPVIRPLYDNSPTDMALAFWESKFISLFRNLNEGQQIADTLLSNLTRVPQDKFESYLLDTYETVRPSINERDVATSTILYYAAHGQTRSNNWCCALLNEAFQQDTIFNVPPLNMFGESSSRDFEVGVIVDDAMYSGASVIGLLDLGFRRFSMKRATVITPFATHHAIITLDRFCRENHIPLEHHYSRIISTVEEVIGDAFFAQLMALSNYKLNRGTTLTYFAHKIPDFRSILPFVADTRHVELDARLPNLLNNGPGVYAPEYLKGFRVKDSVK